MISAGDLLLDLAMIAGALVGLGAVMGLLAGWALWGRG
jgi:hypothetical protein